MKARAGNRHGLAAPNNFGLLRQYRPLAEVSQVFDVIGLPTARGIDCIPFIIFDLLRTWTRRTIAGKIPCVQTIGGRRWRKAHKRREAGLLQRSPAVKAKLFQGKGLVVGIAKDQSIALGYVKDFRALGAEFSVTSQRQNGTAVVDKSKSEGAGAQSCQHRQRRRRDRPAPLIAGETLHVDGLPHHGLIWQHRPFSKACNCSASP